MADSGVAITKSVVVTSHNEWYVEIKGRRVPPQPQSLEGAPSTIQSPADIISLLQHVDACNICKGNPDEKYISVAGTGYRQPHNNEHSYNSCSVSQTLQLAGNAAC